MSEAICEVLPAKERSFLRPTTLPPRHSFTSCPASSTSFGFTWATTVISPSSRIALNRDDVQVMVGARAAFLSESEKPSDDHASMMMAVLRSLEDLLPRSATNGLST